MLSREAVTPGGRRLRPVRIVLVSRDSARPGGLINVGRMNPFDAPDGPFVMLVNDEEQHSLWPVGLAVPGGWRVVHGEASRQSCVDYVEVNWTDIRPLSARRDGARTG